MGWHAIVQHPIHQTSAARQNKLIPHPLVSFSTLAARSLASIHSSPRPPTATNIPPSKQHRSRPRAVEVFAISSSKRSVECIERALF